MTMTPSYRIATRAFAAKRTCVNARANEASPSPPAADAAGDTRARLSKRGGLNSKHLSRPQAVTQLELKNWL